MTDFVKQTTGVFPSVCSLDCPDQCGLLLHKENGRIVKVEGDPNHPVTKGNICNKVRHMTERIYHRDRLRYPLKRIGAKGEGKFTRISWEEAVDTIASRWKKQIKEYGSESILPYSFYGNMGRLNAEGMDRRFFHRLGASKLDRTICASAGSIGYKYTMGDSLGIDPEDTIHSKLIIFWGINAVSTNMHQVALAQQARKQNGAKIIVIDVHKNQTGRFADWFIPIKPGTDSALALGIINILFAEDMIDHDFLDTYTIGKDELRQHVLQYDAQSVAEITGVPVNDIYKLARMYGKASPSFIRIGNGPQHHDNGGMFVRTISCLPALTGQWLLKGGGAIKGNSGYLASDTDYLQRADLLKNKSTRIINMNLLGEALHDVTQPVKSLFVYSCNPAVVAPNANKVREGLKREDLFLVVHDLFLTETAKFADIVLPATSSYENMDFYTSYWHQYIQLQQSIIEPYNESKSNVDVFRLLANVMGFKEELFQESEAEMAAHSFKHPNNVYLEHFTFEELVEHHYLKAKIKPLFPGHLPTPSGKIELYSEKMQEDGFPALPTYVPLKDDSGLPFLYVPAPNHNYLNSTFSNIEKHQKMEKEAKLYMNHQDALYLGIKAGEMVRIWNKQGECVLKAEIGESVLPGVVVSQGIWADQEGKKQLINALTPDRLSDMGGGATFFSGRVAVQRWQRSESLNKE
ncbi:molybdopterin-dependent oxidoreductase [Niallia nealsonii]|uniref:Oxidoreductase n=1 Tax=Niallia nealsonii TaxID=115979 RepID=A0A2N0Z707_9BACI|nr:molybdopterin-dependent oxidoreductase [Niallia nealsonii]PKG25277.1 oxidoreductase [Niallia nealsonii]